MCHFFIDVNIWQFLWEILQGSDRNTTALSIKVKAEMSVMRSAASLRGLWLERVLWNLKWRTEERMKLSLWPPGVADIKYINKGIAAMLWVTSDFGTVEVSRDHLKHHFTAKYHTFVLYALLDKPTAYTSAAAQCVATLDQQMCTQRAPLTLHPMVDLTNWS